MLTDVYVYILGVPLSVQKVQSSATSLQNKADVRHLQEQHSGIQFQCRICGYYFHRRNISHVCNAREEDMDYADPVTDDYGEVAKNKLRSFIRKEQDNYWRYEETAEDLPEPESPYPEISSVVIREDHDPPIEPRSRKRRPRSPELLGSPVSIILEEHQHKKQQLENLMGDLYITPSTSTDSDSSMTEINSPMDIECIRIEKAKQKETSKKTDTTDKIVKNILKYTENMQKRKSKGTEKMNENSEKKDSNNKKEETVVKKKSKETEKTNENGEKKETDSNKKKEETVVKKKSKETEKTNEKGVKKDCNKKNQETDVKNKSKEPEKRNEKDGKTDSDKKKEIEPKRSSKEPEKRNEKYGKIDSDKKKENTEQERNSKDNEKQNEKDRKTECDKKKENTDEPKRNSKETEIRSEKDMKEHEKQDKDKKKENSEV